MPDGGFKPCLVAAGVLWTAIDQDSSVLHVLGERPDGTADVTVCGATVIDGTPHQEYAAACADCSQAVAHPKVHHGGYKPCLVQPGPVWQPVSADSADLHARASEGDLMVCGQLIGAADPLPAYSGVCSICSRAVATVA